MNDRSRIGHISILALTAGMAIAWAPQGGPLAWVAGAVIVGLFLWTFLKEMRS